MKCPQCQRSMTSTAPPSTAVNERCYYCDPDPAREVRERVATRIGEGKAAGVWINGESLWGAHGGMLEFAGVRIGTIFNTTTGDWERRAVLRFADPDESGLESGDCPVDKWFYEITVAVSEEEI